ncbi:MAG TPA: hypothetical protein VHT95_07245 [Vicinamibacterales bacterium]|nr:hypothetical protein [Vicinamibacterales bacterium]
MLPVARCLLLALNVLLLSLPSFAEPALGTSIAFALATILLTIVNVVLACYWDRGSPSGTAATPPFQKLPAVVAGIAASILLAVTAASWLREILIYPHDPQRADMLVVIQLAIHRLLQGGDPYAIYHVPWDVPMPYGPAMWGPLVVPVLLHADVRFITLAGALFVPIACGIAAVSWAARGERALTLAWLTVPLALALSPELRHFIEVGHTPVYWPMLGLFAWLVARDRWYGAAVAAGLLIVARTTMVSIAPVLLIAVWYRARPRLPVAAALLSAATLLPFLPFAIWDPRALQYGLYGSYQSVMKGFVWTSTTWVQHTIGITGWLIACGWSRAVEMVQITVLAAVYALIAAAIRRGARPLPWMALALLAFSMTTLWPVIYLYFDVCLLLICAALAELPQTSTRGVASTWGAPLAASFSAVAIAAWLMIPINAAIDAGTVADRPYLYSGFSSDERQGEITFSWINGTRAEMLIPRRSRRDAVIDIVCEPHLPKPDAVQQLSASLNGTVIGTVTLKDGWQHVELPAPGRAWQIGVNELRLFLSSAVSPKELGLSDDGRKLSLAVDRLMVRTP